MDDAAPVRVGSLHKTFPGPVHALAGVDLEVADGEWALLRGANGSGKSTLLAILAGLAHPTAGDVRVLGAPWGAADARAALGYLDEAAALPPRWTAEALLAAGARLSGTPDPVAAGRAWLGRLDLARVADVPVGTLSHGTRKRVALALALVHTPRLILLDEPLGGLDEPSRALVLDVLAAARAGGATLLVATHWPDVFTACADRAITLANGRVST